MTRHYGARPAAASVPGGGAKREAGSKPSHAAFDELWPERQVLGPVKRRISRKARRAARHREVAALGADWRTRTYHLQNQGWGSRNTGADGLTPRQRRRVKHKANAGRG